MGIGLKLLWTITERPRMFIHTGLKGSGLDYVNNTQKELEGTQHNHKHHPRICKDNCKDKLVTWITCDLWDLGLRQAKVANLSIVDAIQHNVQPCAAEERTTICRTKAPILQTFVDNIKQ